jgi:uncharacterized membrane protein
MDVIVKTTFLISVTLAGLVAGLFFAYACSVNLGLARLTDAEYLKAMQSINRAILNSWFFTAFLGALILLPLATGLVYKHEGATLLFYYLLVAALVYILAVFGVTIFGNVPLNEAVDKFDIASATAEELKRQREIFETPWNRLNLIRTLASVISFVLVALGLINN